MKKIKKVIVQQVGRDKNNPKSRKPSGSGNTIQMIEIRCSGIKRACLSTVYKDNMVLEYEEY